MSATAPCKGTAEKESPPCIQCRYDTKNPGVETEASCARHTATWRRHKRLLAGTATADDMTLTRNLVALDDARIRANRVECARIRAKIRKVVKMERASRVECARAITTCARIRAKIRHNTMLLLLLTPIELRALAKDHGIPCSDDLATDLAAHLDIAASRDDLPPLHAKVTAGPETTWVEYQEQHSEQANGLVGLLQAYFEYGEEYAFFNEMAKKSTARQGHPSPPGPSMVKEPATCAGTVAAVGFPKHQSGNDRARSDDDDDDSKSGEVANAHVVADDSNDSDDDSDLYWGKC